MERRKRRRQSTKHKQSQPPQSDFIRALPTPALLNYLTKHRLLRSPLTKNHTNDHYNRFALLLSTPNDHPQLTTSTHPPPSAYPAPSSSEFYRTLFSPATPTVSLDQPTDPDHSQQQSNRSISSSSHSLFNFDRTLTNTVLSHHRQTFPSLIISHPPPHHHAFTPLSPPSERIPHPLQPSELDSHFSSSSAASSSTTTTHLNYHGFKFNVHLSHPPPSDHIRLIEDHVLSNFLYEVKTRGNAVRPN